jgi:hypothetical protein
VGKNDNMSYIPLTKVVEKTPFNNLEVDIVASDNSELQIQVTKQPFDEDYFFDLSVEEVVKLRDGIDKFIAGRG